MIISLTITLLMSILVALAFLQVNEQWNLATDLDSQLYSQVLAENGLEFATHLLPYLEIEDSLLGSDGVPCEEGRSEWRNPMSLDVAQRVIRGSWDSPCDDGLLPAPPDGPVDTEKSFFVVRFSNNPEEEPFRDFDHILIARSMGIAAGKLRSPFAPEIRNSVTLLEVTLRQELLFLLPGPIVILGDGGDFTFEGNDFLVDGGSRCGILLVGLSDSRLESDLLDALSPEQLSSIRGCTEGPLADGREHYESQYFARLFEVSFWRHFLEHLPAFADPFPPLHEGGLHFLPDGGVLQGSYTGLLVAQGDLLLAESSRFRGVLIHLGNGQLKVSDQAEITGGVWLSNLDCTGDQLESQDVSLAISGSSRIIYEPGSIRAALQALPATQLGWRMVFPEMDSE